MASLIKVREVTEEKGNHERYAITSSHHRQGNHNGGRERRTLQRRIRSLRKKKNVSLEIATGRRKLSTPALKLDLRLDKEDLSIEVTEKGQEPL